MECTLLPYTPLFLVFFKNVLSSSEKKRNTPEGRKSDQCVNNSAY